MTDFEAAYDSFGSRYGNGKAAGARGSFARYLDEGQGSLSRFAGSLDNTFEAPSASNGAAEAAYADDADARNIDQWGSGLSRISQEQDQFNKLGLNSAQQLQQVKQAKEMAQLNAQSAQQSANFSMISSGLSALGSIGSFGKSKGWFGGSKTTGGGVNWQQTPRVGNTSYGGSYI